MSFARFTLYQPQMIQDMFVWVDADEVVMMVAGNRPDGVVTTLYLTTTGEVTVKEDMGEVLQRIEANRSKNASRTS